MVEIDRRSAREKLEEATAVISAAAMLLNGVAPTLEAFLRESRDMDSFGHIVDPTLWRDPERRATEALLKPLYQAAFDFTKLYKAQLATAADALAKVQANG